MRTATLHVTVTNLANYSEFWTQEIQHVVDVNVVSLG